jgi:hypothetical protein
MGLGMALGRSRQGPPGASCMGCSRRGTSRHRHHAHPDPPAHGRPGARSQVSGPSMFPTFSGCGDIVVAEVGGPFGAEHVASFAGAAKYLPALHHVPPPPYPSPAAGHHAHLGPAPGRCGAAPAVDPARALVACSPPAWCRTRLLLICCGSWCEFGCIPRPSLAWPCTPNGIPPPPHQLPCLLHFMSALKQAVLRPQHAHPLSSHHHHHCPPTTNNITHRHRHTHTNARYCLPGAPPDGARPPPPPPPPPAGPSQARPGRPWNHSRSSLMAPPRARWPAQGTSSSASGRSTLRRTWVPQARLAWPVGPPPPLPPPPQHASRHSRTPGLPRPDLRFSPPTPTHTRSSAGHQARGWGGGVGGGGLPQQGLRRDQGRQGAGRKGVQQGPVRKVGG